MVNTTRQNPSLGQPSETACLLLHNQIIQNTASLFFCLHGDTSKVFFLLFGDTKIVYLPNIKTLGIPAVLKDKLCVIDCIPILIKIKQANPQKVRWTASGTDREMKRVNFAYTGDKIHQDKNYHTC